MKKIAYLLTLVFCLSLIPFSPLAAQPLVNWSGMWETDWGKLTLYQVGDKVTGNYEHDQGKVVGYVKGNILVGTWSEAPSYSAPKDAGDLKWVLAGDGKSFSGNWCYGSYNGSWNGSWEASKN